MTMGLKTRFAAALTITTALAGQVEAWTVTSKAAGATSSSATATVAGQSYTAGNIIGVTGMSRGSTGADVLTLSGSASGMFPSGNIFICSASGSANKAFIAWIIAAGGAETITLTNSAGPVTGLTLHTFQIDGAAPVSPEDLGARSCNPAQGLSPSVTSGMLAENDELLISVTARIGSSMGFTEDVSWTQIGSEYGSTNLRAASSYKESPGIGPATHNPAVTQSNSSIAMVAFKAVSPPPFSRRPKLGTLMGVD